MQWLTSDRLKKMLLIGTEFGRLLSGIGVQVFDPNLDLIAVDPKQADNDSIANDDGLIRVERE